MNIFEVHRILVFKLVQLLKTGRESDKLFGKQSIKLPNKANLFSVVFFEDVPLAFVRCIGRDPSNKEPTPGELVTGAYFDKRSVQEIECGITLNNVGNISATNLIRTIEALTSQSHLLNEDNLITGAEVLSKALGKFEQVTQS